MNTKRKHKWAEEPRLVRGLRPRHDPLMKLFAMIRQDNPQAYQELLSVFEKDQKRK